MCLLDAPLLTKWNFLARQSFFMRDEQHSTLSEKITAAAAVATAAAATKTTVETTKARQEMEAINRAMQLSAKKQERIQFAMASEQAETNFRNTVLATLPLLKTEKERIQFLTEQFVPKLQNTEDDIVLFPLQWVVLSAKKNNTLENYLESKAAESLKKFLSESKDLSARSTDWAERVAEFNDTQEKLDKMQNPLDAFGFIKAILWGFLFFVIVRCFVSWEWLIFLAFLVGLVFQLALNFSKKQKLESKIKILDSATTKEEEQSLRKETELRDSKWKTFKSQIVKHLIEEYKPIITSDARAIILESVTLRLKEGIRDFQSFLPPSVRLPASHYAEFLFTDEDVEKYKMEQNNIVSLLEEEFEPDYENETVVWVGDSQKSEESEEEESFADESENSEEDEDSEEDSEDSDRH